jgi:hypothetical protein
MYWATFWAIFSLTRQVTLVLSHHGVPLWQENVKINKIKRSQVRSPAQETAFKGG